MRDFVFFEKFNRLVCRNNIFIFISKLYPIWERKKCWADRIWFSVWCSLSRVLPFQESPASFLNPSGDSFLHSNNRGFRHTTNINSIKPIQSCKDYWFRRNWQDSWVPKNWWFDHWIRMTATIPMWSCPPDYFSLSHSGKISTIFL